MMAMKSSLLSVALSLCTTMLLSQVPGHITVKAGEDAVKVIPYSDQFHYKEFRQGQLYYPKSQRSENMKLNFNLVVQNVMFINEQGDTLELTESENIFKFARIGGDLYYHDFREGFFLLLTRDPKVQLAVQNSWKAIRKEQVVNNGYGNISSAGGTEVSARRSTESTSFVQYEDAIYSKAKEYFLVTHDEKLFKANRAGFMKLYQDYKDQIRDYVKSKDLDFNKEDDLRELVTYCQEITKVIVNPVKS